MDIQAQPYGAPQPMAMPGQPYGAPWPMEIPGQPYGHTQQMMGAQPQNYAPPQFGAQTQPHPEAPQFNVPGPAGLTLSPDVKDAPAPGGYQGGQPLQSNLQTVVCPKCRFTADIPPVAKRMKLRCQECGHRFMIKPESKKKTAAAKAPAQPGAKKSPPKGVLALLLLVLILAAVLLVGPVLLPGIIPQLF
jgi:DNA-directed RNA polymerase subunit RPC12/RpoP